MVPSQFRPTSDAERRTSRAYRESNTDTSDGSAHTDIIDMSASRRGQHRRIDGGADKGR